MRNSCVRVVQCAVFCAAAWASTAFAAFEPFVVRNFRVEGAQRISEGTIYNYLPINIGDTVDERRLREAGRALFETSFFQDFEFRRDGDTLVIVVLERPSILEFTFDGNKDIKDDDLEKVLTENGLATGKTFDQSTLDQLTQSLTEEYYGRGKYGAKVTPTVEPVPDNRVRVSIQIEEGDRAKIRQVNIVGNTSFEEQDIIADFELSTGNWLSFIRQNDRYAREALEGDLEKLRSFYMDRGFADFRTDDVQVAISPDKRDIFVTISITEGDRYTISEVKLAGEMVVPEQDLELLMLAQPGQTFSQAVLTQSEEFMQFRLGRDGYAFAEVRAVPELNEETKEASITFFVDPRNRVYVRRINFNGADNVNDEVFRREMRQLEGGYLSNALVDRSKLSLQQLPYVENVEHETTPVPGSPDLVDVDFEVEEGLPGQFGGSLGYSETYGITLGGNFIHSNFMGTGRRVALELRGGEYQKIYDINFTDPYRNIDGVSRTISLTYQDITQYTSVTSDFSTTTLSGGMNWTYPVGNFQRLTLGFAYQDSELLTSQYSSRQAVGWVTQNGDPVLAPDGFVGTDVKSLDVITAWTFDTRNAALFPTAGTRINAGISASIPGSDVESTSRASISRSTSRSAGVGCSESTTSSRSARRTATPQRYRRSATATPAARDPCAASRKAISARGTTSAILTRQLALREQFELIIPTPEKIAGSTRIGLFFDVGNVFSTGGVLFFDKLGDPIDYDFNYDNLKKSVGIGVEWLAPLGLLRFSYATPLNEDAATDRFFGDEVERFQFSIGNAF